MDSVMANVDIRLRDRVNISQSTSDEDIKFCKPTCSFAYPPSLVKHPACC